MFRPLREIDLWYHICAKTESKVHFIQKYCILFNQDYTGITLTTFTGKTRFVSLPKFFMKTFCFVWLFERTSKKNRFMIAFLVVYSYENCFLFLFSFFFGEWQLSMDVKTSSKSFQHKTNYLEQYSDLLRKALVKTLYNSYCLGCTWMWFYASHKWDGRGLSPRF